MGLFFVLVFGDGDVSLVGWFGVVLFLFFVFNLDLLNSSSSLMTAQDGICVCENPKEVPLLICFFQYFEKCYFFSETFIKSSLDTDTLYPTNLYYRNLNLQYFKSIFIPTCGAHHRLLPSTP